MDRESDMISSETMGTSGNVSLKVYSVNDIPIYQRWRQLDESLKLRVLDYYSPDRSLTTHNVTCVGLHETVATALNRSIPVDQQINTISVGSGGSTDPQVGDRELNNHVVDTDITEYQTNGTETTVRGLIDTNQANGSTLQEIGVRLANGKLANHALSESIEKTNSETVTVRIDLSVGDM